MNQPKIQLPKLRKMDGTPTSHVDTKSELPKLKLPKLKKATV